MELTYTRKVAQAHAELKADFIRGARTPHGTISRPLVRGIGCNPVVAEHIDSDELQAFLALVLASGHHTLAAQAEDLIERAAEDYAGQFADARVLEEEGEAEAHRVRYEGQQLDREFHRGYGVTL